MSKKWSQKGIKSTLVADDEFMILDSEDANNATKNKRVKTSTARDSLNNSFSFQTVGATTEQQAFLFNGAITLIVLISASNAGNTKGYSATAMCYCTLTTANNSFSVTVASDFSTASISVAATSNTITFSLNGEAGETINWKGSVSYVSI